MSVILLCGNHPRHRFIAESLMNAGLLSALVVERRENSLPQSPTGIPRDLELLFHRHFEERKIAESRFFGEAIKFPSNVPFIEISRHELNSAKVHAFLKVNHTDFLISYGVHVLSEDTLASSQARYKWNLHGGLSPWYRGCITHFWPSYMLEPQMTGFTIHELTSELDNGPIIHQTGVVLVRGDGLHELACRAVLKLSEELPLLLKYAISDHIETKISNRSGKVWTAKDWRPDHLRLIYHLYENRIVDACLDGSIRGKDPELVRQW